MARKILSLSLLILLGLFYVLPVSAAVIETGENYSLTKDRTISENLYALGGNLTLNGKTEGDLAAFGGTVLFFGETTQDLTVGAGNITIAGNVGEDLRAAGGTLVISGKVNGEAMVAGGQIVFNEDSLIEKDLIMAGGVILLDGTVNGQTQLRGGEIRLNGKFKGPVRVFAEKLTIGKDTVIDGELVYNALEEAQIDQNAQLNGGVKFNKTTKPGNKIPWLPVLGTIWLIKLAMSLAFGLVFYWLFRRYVKELVRQSLNKFNFQLLRGFVILCLLPIAIIILLVSVIGILLAIMSALIYLLAIIIASSLAGMLLGSLIFKLFNRREELKVDWMTVSVGLIVIQLIGLIPFIGWIAVFVLFLAAFGGLFYYLYNKIR